MEKLFDVIIFHCYCLQSIKDQSSWHNKYLIMHKKFPCNDLFSNENDLWILFFSYFWVICSIMNHYNTFEYVLVNARSLINMIFNNFSFFGFIGNSSAVNIRSHRLHKSWIWMNHYSRITTLMFFVTFWLN